MVSSCKANQMWVDPAIASGGVFVQGQVDLAALIDVEAAAMVGRGEDQHLGSGLAAVGR